jgi:hypothetical protein
MPAPTTSSDPWTFFLDWLTTVLVPSWGDLISLLPYFLILFVIGPILTLLVLAWAWHLLRRRRGRVHRAAAQPAPAPRDADGAPQFPPNVPYCEDHALLYPARARRCDIDHADLLVACPVDGTVRAADIRTCPSCGTTYILGAGTSALVVTSAGGPPEGGAAIA